MKHLHLMQEPLIPINRIPGSDIPSSIQPGYVQSCAAERVPFIVFKSLPPWVLQPNAIICLLPSEMGVLCPPHQIFTCLGPCLLLWAFLFLVTLEYSMSGHVCAFLFANLSFFLGCASWCVSICCKLVANYICS